MRFMIAYLNLSGDSCVNAFQSDGGAITVRFADGWCHRYTDASAGRETVARMKSLAAAGQGLCRFLREDPRLAQAYYDKWFCPDPIAHPRSPP